MRAAPLVRASLDDAGPERALIALLHGSTGAAMAAWAWGQLDGSPTAATVLAAVAMPVAAAALGLRLARSALPAGAVHLQWDGQAWSLGLRRPGGPAASASEMALSGLEVALDLGHWVLLRLQPAAGGQRWQVARAACAGTAWHGLRVALAAHAGNTVPRLGAST